MNVLPAGAALEPTAHLRAMINNAPMVLWMLDEHGVFTFSEGRGLEVLGLRPGEVVGRSVFEVYAEAGTVLEDARRALAGETRASLVRLGETWFDTRSAPMHDPSGRIIGMVGVALDVTDRQTAQQELARSLSLLRATLESTADGILVVDLEGRIVTHNRMMASLWRIPDELFATGEDDRVIGSVLNQLRDPDAFVNRVRHLYSNPADSSFDVVEFRDGRVFERYSQPQKVGSEVVGRVWSFRDVTYRQLAEDELLRREAQLARTQAIAGLGSWEWEVTRDYIFWSDEMYRIAGMEPQSERITLDRYRDLVHPEDRERVQSIIERALVDHQPFSFEHRFVALGGGVRTVHSIGEVVAEDGAPVRMLGTAQDITELRAAAEALRVSENRFRTVFEQFPFSIQIFAPDGSTLEVNREWSRFFGVALDDVGGFNPLTDPQLAEIAPFIRQAFDGETVTLPPALFDPRQMFSSPERGNGGDARAEEDREAGARWVQAFMCPVKRDDGSVREVFAVHQDVTREREAEAILRRSNEELERLVRDRTVELAEANAMLEEEIAERERAEEELRRKSSELEAIFRALPDSYVRLADDGTIVETRTGMETNGSVWPTDWAGERLPNVLPPSARDGIERALLGVRRDGRVARIEYTSDEDGQSRDFEARLVPLSGTEIIAIIREITDRKEAERALQKSEEHFRLLIENSSDVATILGPDGTNRYQSPSITGVLGYSPEELVGTRAFERIHPDDLAAAGEALREAVLNPGTAVSAEFRYLHKQGSYRYLEARAKTLLPDSAEAGVVVNSRDVTDRHAAEMELQKREEHFRRLIENGSDLIQLMRPDGEITYTSPSAQRLLGYDPAEMLGRTVADLIHTDDVESIDALRREIVEAPGETRSAEFRIRHRDGSWRVFEGVARTVSPESAEEGLVANSRDITDRKGFEEALRHAMSEAETAREAAERANRAKSEFLSRMSHELRTPLNSVLGFAQVLARKETPPDQRKAIDHIQKAGRHLLNLINEVLDIARIESNRQALSLEPVQVRAVVAEVLNLIHPLATERGCEIEECKIEESWYVQADRQRLTQVLLNLLSNAVKYNRPGGRVWLGCEKMEANGARSLRISVSDAGIGIPRDSMGELFTPFARLGAEQTAVEGTGLGLALSLRLVQAMNGTLEAESTVGEGSTFTIELPLVDSPLEGWSPARAARLERHSSGTRLKPATLLYVEDNLANLALIETVLTVRPEVTVIPALQGQIGIELATEHQPDIILLDLHLPDMSGVEVLRRLRAQERTRGIPVIIVSADATPDSMQRLENEGANAYVTKPIDVDEFLGVIERLLEQRSDRERRIPTNE
jgi:PAS domain S-box-containing protein